MWIICAILTACDVFPSDSSVYGYAARTDLKTENLKNSPWISFPYPANKMTWETTLEQTVDTMKCISLQRGLGLGACDPDSVLDSNAGDSVSDSDSVGQWGWPTFNIAAIIGTFSAVVVSILDSVGDYHACSQVAHVPTPPDHAINRGIGVEGVGGLMASVWGTGIGVVSYSGDIALLSLTKAASRSILIGSGSIFILVGFFTKLIALFNGIPKPVLAASSIQVGMVSSIGLSNLSSVKMDSSRNLLVVGFSLFVAIGVPEYLGRHPGSIDTGSQTVDNILEALLLNGMLVGAVISTFLDLVIPGVGKILSILPQIFTKIFGWGLQPPAPTSYTFVNGKWTPEERGANWRELVETDKDDANYIESSFHEAYRVYDLPFGGKWLTKQKWTRFIPFSPTFQSDTKVDADCQPHFELKASE
ncbi:Solute carrier family 23 member 1 [Holothuria leucospilota]|uniref:Solute carrier family 23 member 1 n=1 Tax=Holothuria leucospilota TaxID=206669 RepID=A0A9Q1CKJ9_HOLLE|nr:Solute carrier family 23 member 1 [Holothuria leucospilota]